MPSEELKTLFVKIIIPALVAMSINLAVQSRKGKVSLFNAIASIIIGIGCAYLSSEWVMATFNNETIPIAVAVITITGEKVAYWLIFKFNFDIIGDGIIQYFLDKYKSKNK